MDEIKNLLTQLATDQKSLKETTQDIKETQKELDSKVDKLTLDSLSLTKDTKANSKVLEEHIRRTELLEKRVDKVEIPTKLLGWIGVPLGLVVSLLGILWRLGVL